MEETAVDEQAQVLDVLAHPDPDPESLPMLREDTALALQEQTAGHLIRAIMRQGDSIEKLKQAMSRDLQAWAEVIARAEMKQTNWRTIVRDWMLRNGITNLQAPWFTTSIAKGRTKIVVDNEEECIAIVKKMGATAAWESKERLVKKEFDVIFNSTPERFVEKKNVTTGEVSLPSLAHEETGDPSLVIRRKQNGK